MGADRILKEAMKTRTKIMTCGSVFDTQTWNKILEFTNGHVENRILQ